MRRQIYLRPRRYFKWAIPFWIVFMLLSVAIIPVVFIYQVHFILPVLALPITVCAVNIIKWIRRGKD